MDELIAKLEELYSKDVEENSEYYEEEGEWYFKDYAQRDVELLANELLIGSGGSCNWENVNLLRSSGYNVFPGDRDSFGWLVGCIQKFGDVRIVCYG